MTGTTVGRHTHRPTIRGKVRARVVENLMSLVEEKRRCRGQQVPIDRIRGGIVNETNGGRRSLERQHP